MAQGGRCQQQTSFDRISQPQHNGNARISCARTTGSHINETTAFPVRSPDGRRSFGLKRSGTPHPRINQRLACRVSFAAHRYGRRGVQSALGLPDRPFSARASRRGASPEGIPICILDARRAPHGERRGHPDRISSEGQAAPRPSAKRVHRTRASECATPAAKLPLPHCLANVFFAESGYAFRIQLPSDKIAEWKSIAEEASELMESWRTGAREDRQ